MSDIQNLFGKALGTVKVTGIMLSDVFKGPFLAAWAIVFAYYGLLIAYSGVLEWFKSGWPIHAGRLYREYAKTTKESGPFAEITIEQFQEIFLLDEESFAFYGNFPFEEESRHKVSVLDLYEFWRFGAITIAYRRKIDESFKEVWLLFPDKEQYAQARRFLRDFSKQKNKERKEAISCAEQEKRSKIEAQNSSQGPQIFEAMLQDLQKKSKANPKQQEDS